MDPIEMRAELEAYKEALEASEARFRNIIEKNADGVIVLGEDGSILYVNPSAESLLNRDSSQILGTSFGIPILPGETTELDIPRGSGDVRIAEMRVVHTDWEGRPALLASLRDVTERKRAEEELRVGEIRLRLMVEHVKDYAIYVLDPQGRVVSWNAGAERIKGWKAEEVLGENHAIFYRAEDIREGRPERELERAVREGQSEGETWSVRKDGSLFWARTTVTAIRDTDGKLKGFGKVTRDVTEARLAEQRLRDQFHLINTITTNAAEGLIMLNAEGQVTYMNPAAEALLGWTREELHHKSFHNLVHHRYPDGKPFAEEDCPFSGILQSGETIRVREDFVIRRDGVFLPVLCSGAPIFSEDRVSGAVIAMHDVTDLKHAEMERERLLRDVERRAAQLDAVIASIPDAVYVGNEAGLVTCNGPAMEMLGFDRGDKMTRSFSELSREILKRSKEPGVRIPLDEEAFALALQGESCVREVSSRHLKSGQEMVLRSAAAPIRHGGKIIGAVAINTDITDRKRLERELQRRVEELAEADRSKDEFLAMLAHELRNPLAPILNALQIMRLKGDDPSIRGRMRDMIEQQVRHLSRLVEDLLDVSRITRGKIQLRKETVDVSLVIERAVETVRGLIEKSRHKLKLRLPDDPLRIEADPTRLEQILVNLLSNSAKYTEPGGSIELIAEVEDERLVIRVKDNGVGIAPELLTRIFDLFIQADRSLDRSQGGLGIGLTMVRSLVELHSGTIEVKSQGPGTGSEFIIRLPLGAQSTSDEPFPAPEEDVSAITPRSVLVVDDNVYSAESLAVLVKLWGHRAEVAYSGPAALELAQKLQPQIVLLDIGLPGMDGYKVARQIRANPPLKNTLLVAMTGYGQEEDRRSSREAGFDYHLVKPLDLDALERLISAHELSAIPDAHHPIDPATPLNGPTT